MVIIIIIRVIPALGAAKIGDIVASQSHTLATLTALVSRCVVDGKVLQILAGKCSLGNQNRKSINGQVSFSDPGLQQIFVMKGLGFGQD